MKKILFSLLFALVLIPAGVCGTLYSLNNSGFFSLDHIELSIEKAEGQYQFLSPLIADLNKQLSKHRGTSLWDLDLKKVSEQISSQKWVAQSFVTRSWPSQLKVRLAPRSVKLLYVNRAGKMFPVVEDGTMLNPVSAKSAPDVALIQGDIFEKDLDVRRRAVNTINEIPLDGKFSQKNISELRFDSKQGFWATLIGTGMRVKLGEEKISLKAARVSQVIEYMETRQLEARVIDANLSKKVLVRLRKDP
jgi:cell division protein FtsQ